MLPKQTKQFHFFPLQIINGNDLASSLSTDTYILIFLLILLPSDSYIHKDIYHNESLLPERQNVVIYTFIYQNIRYPSNARHVGPCSSLFLVVSCCMKAWIHHTSLNYSPNGRPYGCFHIFVSMNNATVNIFVNRFLCRDTVISAALFSKRNIAKKKGIFPF